MTKLFRFFFQPEAGSPSLFLIRLPVGLIFLTEGILKFIDPSMGVVRFTGMGFPHPYFTAHFVGSFEIICGGLLLLGLWTRAASMPLLIIITIPIATTKIPEPFHANQGLLSATRAPTSPCSARFFSCFCKEAEPGPSTRSANSGRTGRHMNKFAVSLRDFLRTAAGFTAGSCLPSAPPRAAGIPEQSAGDATADYTLHIKASALEIAPKRIVSAVTYSGQFPGPLLRFKEGQQATVDVFNETDAPSKCLCSG